MPMSNDINPFTNADETARRHADANEAVLATVENLSSDSAMAAVSDVDKDSKYACRVPANLTVQEGDSVIVDTAAGGRPFVTAIVDRTSALSTDSGFDGPVDDYKYMTFSNNRTRLFQANEERPASLTGGFRGEFHSVSGVTDSVYAVEDDDFWVVMGGSNLERIQTSPNNGYTLNSLFILNDPFGSGAFISTLAWDSNNENIICGLFNSSSNPAVGAINKDSAGSYTTVWETELNTTGRTATVDHASDGYIYIVDDVNGTLYQLDEAGNVNDNTSVSGAAHLAVRPDQNVVVTDSDGDIQSYDDTLTQQNSASNPISGNGASTSVSATSSSGAIVATDGGWYHVDDTLSYGWIRPGVGSEFIVLGVTPQNRAVLQHEFDNLSSGTVDVSVITADDGDEIYVHQRSDHANISGQHGVVSKRPGSYPNDFN